MDVSKFNSTTSNIMLKNQMDLTPDEVDFRFFIRCITLYHDLALGRNITALSCLISKHKFLGLSFQEVFDVMKSEAVPRLVRAHYTTIMLYFFIDRDPQHNQPVVYYTRKLALDQTSTVVDHCNCVYAYLDTYVYAYADTYV